MFQVPLCTSSSVFAVEKFWTSVLLYYNRPNLVNRKIATAVELILCEATLQRGQSISKINEVFTREALLYEIRKLNSLSDVTLRTIEEIVTIQYKDISLNKTSWADFADRVGGIFISLRMLLGRAHGNTCIEAVIFNKTDTFVTFFAVQEHDTTILAPTCPYHVQLNTSGCLQLTLNSFEDADTTGAEWLADKLFPKLLKWADTDADVAGNSIRSLSLVDEYEYCALYNKLKLKYGSQLVKVWSEKANTDPKKFVYEDLAIASYLICVWKSSATEDIEFVDCGCGNGLLVYILNKEGYSGYGIDIRSRQIWDLFLSNSSLKVGIVSPTSVFPKSTWIIGNHSDELTPWIPVIAMNSSHRANFFVLPCCPYDFSGRKYIRMNTGVSQYCDYLKYIEDVAKRCGFDTQIDKLRIPSTKRICLVGRAIENRDLDNIKSAVALFIESRLITKFIPRCSIEKVRNCTQLDKDLIARIVGVVVSNLLASSSYLKREYDGKEWNKGGAIDLGTLSKIVAPEDKRLLKSECGGLQTLLKNHRYLFRVQSGIVALREPMALSEETAKYSEKPCWFYRNHPDSCLFSDSVCAYKH